MGSFQYRKLLVADGPPMVVETAFGWCPIDCFSEILASNKFSIPPYAVSRLLNLSGECLDY